MRIISTAFSDGAFVPSRFTCDGENTSPPLTWADAPPGTRSFVLLCDDPDAPAGTWHHWAVYDIPPELHALREGVPARAQEFKQAMNDFHQPGYGGPCPPRRHGTHHYRFRLLALSIDRLALGNSPSCGEVERAARPHVLAETTLVGVYKR